MIERFVFIRLKDDFVGDDKRWEIADHSRSVIEKVPGVEGVSIGLPGDERCENDWDIVITVKFHSINDISIYSNDGSHRDLVDNYLTPRMDGISAWNFEMID